MSLFAGRSDIGTVCRFERGHNVPFAIIIAAAHVLGLEDAPCSISAAVAEIGVLSSHFCFEIVGPLLGSVAGRCGRGRAVGSCIARVFEICRAQFIQLIDKPNRRGAE